MKNRLEEIRKEKGINQEELALELEVSRQTISSLENGRYNPSILLLIPIQCEYYSLEGVGQLIDTVKLVKKSLNPKLEIEGVLLNMFDGRTNLSIQVVEEVKKYFKDKVYRTVIPRSVRLAEAPSFGQPIMIYDEKSKGSIAYIKLSEELIKNN